MRVSQILSHKGREIFSIPPESSVIDLVHTLAEKKVGALLVSGTDRTIAGIVSERDIVRALGTHASSKHASSKHDQASHESVLHLPVASIMTSDVVTVSPDTEISDLMRLMTERRIRHVPVVDEDNTLVGMVSIGDVVKDRMDELESEHAALVDYITQGG